MSAVVFRLPDVGEGLAEAEIVDWLVAAGSAVRADQPVVIVETAKAQVELPAPADGVVRELSHQPGDAVPVGGALFVLDTAATTGSGEEQPEPVAAAVPGGRDDAAPSDGRRRVLAAPSTRRFAIEHGIDLAEVTGSGPAGRVLRADVLHVLDTRCARGPGGPATEPAAESGTEARPLRGLRRQMARAMTDAAAIPHITEFREIDATALEQGHQVLRAQAHERGERLTLLAVLVRVLVAALRQHPDLNATFDPDTETVHVHRHLDLGIATATADGLIVPVLRGAAGRSVPELAGEISRLADAARHRTLAVRDTSGGSFTVSNFGSYGTWLGTPLINPPQVAIAGFGRAHDAVVPVDGAPAVRRVLPVVVAADHRLIDGEALASFMTTLERLITVPLLLLGEG